MLRASSLRLSALALLILLVGVAVCAFLAYFVLGLVQLTTFMMELISRGGYG